MEHIREEMVYSLCGCKVVEWAIKGSQGRLGGLLIMWKTCIINLNFTFIGEGFFWINTLRKGQSIRSLFTQIVICSLILLISLSPSLFLIVRD